MMRKLQSLHTKCECEGRVGGPTKQNSKSQKTKKSSTTRVKLQNVPKIEAKIKIKPGEETTVLQGNPNPNSIDRIVKVELEDCFSIPLTTTDARYSSREIEWLDSAVPSSQIIPPKPVQKLSNSSKIKKNQSCISNSEYMTLSTSSEPSTCHDHHIPEETSKCFLGPSYYPQYEPIFLQPTVLETHAEIINQNTPVSGRLPDLHPALDLQQLPPVIDQTTLNETALDLGRGNHIFSLELARALGESIFDFDNECSKPGAQCQCGEKCCCPGCRTHYDNPGDRVLIDALSGRIGQFGMFTGEDQSHHHLESFSRLS